MLLISQESFRQSEACKCNVQKLPLRCLADFVAIIRVTGTDFDKSLGGHLHWRRYDFSLLFLIFDRYFLAGFQRYRHFWTPNNQYACGVRLDVGKVYLIGARYDFYNDRLELFACTSLVRPLTREWHRRKWRIYGKMRTCLEYSEFIEKNQIKKLPAYSNATLVDDDKK
ncbi:hypothetical protein QR98_0051800 [Sarcoptes scabiei]|uniref:Uncharacterized protein n=1 Tax=Sarcoptes scabiei TaxID=52283 RepID=A0A132A6W8_SARSC|nr:hypothetical protein QR98_0051800 [Sarcoptes scabiei]